MDRAAGMTATAETAKNAETEETAKRKEATDTTETIGTANPETNGPAKSLYAADGR